MSQCTGSTKLIPTLDQVDSLHGALPAKTDQHTDNGMKHVTHVVLFYRVTEVVKLCVAGTVEPRVSGTKGADPI
jgi:hypothetical protein